MKWVLILIVAAGSSYRGGVAVESVSSFETKELCEFAMQQVLNTVPTAKIAAGCYPLTSE
jgi:hypothetical protein